ncbi:PfkB family carbohydrate kinase [Salinirubellus sp. GCM10025818]|uniref:PfkB family carbohydrate kinase n=1 Tax=Salinirubellus TaxID=2162630 RepID=UPI0030CF674E
MLVTLGETALGLSPPGAGRLERADRLDVQVSGAESNAGVVARRLGEPVTWLSRLPDSPLGRRVASELRGYDLDVRVSWGGGRQGLTFHERGGPPRGDDRVDDRTGAAAASLSMDDLPLEPVERADVAYVTGATPALSNDLAGATARFLKTANDAGATTAFSLEYRPWLWPGPDAARETLTGFFPAVDVFVAREADVETVLERSGSPAELTHGLAAEWGFEYVLLTRERTCVVYHDATVHEYPNPTVDAVDTTGRAAAFAGAFLAAHRAGSDPTGALKTAVAARALAATIPGSVPTLTRSEIERVAGGIESASDADRTR